MAWLERKFLFRNLWRHNLVNNQLQYTHWPISQEVKAIKQTFSLRNHRQNLVEKLFQDPSLKNQNWAWISSLKFHTVCQVEDYRNTLKLSCRPHDFTSYEAFLKIKKRPRTSLPASFSTRFLRRNIPFVILYYLIKFHHLVSFFFIRTIL